MTVLEDYFDFLTPDDIRLKGRRIGIEHIIYFYTNRGWSAEEIADYYGTLSLEQVYATILYYLRNKEQVHALVTEWIEYGERTRAEQQHNPSEFVLRVRQLKAEREAQGEREREWQAEQKREQEAQTAETLI